MIGVVGKAIQPLKHYVVGLRGGTYLTLLKLLDSGTDQHTAVKRVARRS
jgi:hypothetical protein